MQFDQWKRREFIALLGGAVSWPFAARAQQPAMPVIGFLSGRTQTADAHLVVTFHNGLKETGYIEGQNITTEYRWAEGQYDRLPDPHEHPAEDQCIRVVKIAKPTGSQLSERSCGI
jgi:hypothetical protein